MANSHFGNLGDVWKHLVLAEVLEREPPRWYAETHAGSAAYLLNRDPQREFGIWRFLAAAPRSAELARSRYYAIAGSCASASPASYPGSPLLAMTILGNSSSYLLCDLDPGSVADLRSWSRQLGLRNCEVAGADGMAAVAAYLARGEGGGDGLVHVDPFEPDAAGPGGASALECAAGVADSGSALLFWYASGQAPSRTAPRRGSGRSRMRRCGAARWLSSPGMSPPAMPGGQQRQASLAWFSRTCSPPLPAPARPSARRWRRLMPVPRFPADHRPV